MKAISLWQPWASLMVLGSKKIETRNWYTGHRGPMLIHAAKRINKGELIELSDWREFHAAFHALGGTRGKDTLFNLPYGALIGTVQLIDCKPTERIANSEIMHRRGVPGATEEQIADSLSGMWWTEYTMGNYADNRFGWVCANPVMFDKPIPYKGSQGFFDVSVEDAMALALAKVVTA